MKETLPNASRKGQNRSVEQYASQKRKETSMPRTQETDEIRILRYFEEGPLEKAELMYNIVAQKMRIRLNHQPDNRKKPEKRRTEMEIRAGKTSLSEANSPAPS